MASSLSVVGGFFLRCVLWLAPLLALWFWAGDWVIRPPTWLAERAMLGFFPSWVLDVELRDGSALLKTTFKAVGPGGRVAELYNAVHVMKYAYGLPLLLALLLGARASGVWWKFPLGALALVVFQAWGVCFEWLSNIAVQVGDLTRAQTGFGYWQTTGIVLGKQLGYLIFPTLVPLLIWFGFERQFLRSVILEGALDGLVRVGRVRH